MTFSNKLTEAEAERLAMLAEEAGEIVQIVGKILRHGYESYHPQNPMMSNRDLLHMELRDLVAVHILMMDNEDLRELQSEEVIDALKAKMIYAHHQKLVSE